MTQAIDLLPGYAAGKIRRGASVPIDRNEASFVSVMTVHERELEIELPPLAGHVFVVAPETRRRVRHRLDGRVREQRFHDGHSSLMPRGSTPWWSSDGCSGRMIHLHFTSHVERRVFEDDRGLELRPVAPSADPVARRLVELMLADSARSFGDGLLADSLAASILAHLYKLHGSHAPQPRKGGLAPWQLNRVTELLESRLDRDVRLEELAAEARLSPFHFARAFRTSTGQTPHRYLIQRRLAHACCLLGETDIPVIEVAALVGYADPGHFAKLLKREVGLTPLAYRRECAR